MPYRRTNGNDTWHWCRNCSEWPVERFDETPAIPSTGKLCKECREKQNAGNCPG